MKRVLVTGASGFIGRPLLPLLVAAGFEVHAVGHSAPHGHPAAVQWHRADLLDATQAKALVRRAACSHLIHLAWYTTPPVYWEAPENRAWVEASSALFREFADAGGKRILATGSCAEYSWKEGPCKEDITPLEPGTLYGKSKVELQRRLAGWAQGDIEWAWARIFFPYGPGEHPSKLVSSLAIALLKGEPAHCATPEVRRDFIYVSDAASALAAVLQSEFFGTINVGCGVAAKVREIAEKTAHKIGRPDLLHFNSPEAGRSDHSVVVADVTRLRHQVRWLPQHDLSEGISQTVAWCAERQRAPGT
jgi:nucleoside-diphosphate-sugar epimerase